MGKPTPTMLQALELANKHGGKLKRFPGGYWCAPGERLSRPWFGTPTVEALVNRGFMAYSEWVDGKHGRFPVEATVRER